VRCSNADFSALSANSAVKIAVRQVQYLVDQYRRSENLCQADITAFLREDD
jgi:hypothetical protein